MLLYPLSYSLSIFFFKRGLIYSNSETESDSSTGTFNALSRSATSIFNWFVGVAIKNFLFEVFLNIITIHSCFSNSSLSFQYIDILIVGGRRFMKIGFKIQCGIVKRHIVRCSQYDFETFMLQECLYQSCFMFTSVTIFAIAVATWFIIISFYTSVLYLPVS